MTDRRRILVAATALALLALAAPAESSAQEFGAPPEFWSSSYQRFHRTLHHTPPLYVGAQAGENLIAPPDVIICQPRTLGAATQGEILESEDGVVTTLSAALPR
jgi:hypothetical protein